MWETKIGIEPYMWNQLYTNIYKCCPDNRIKQFKFKLFHNIIAMNENLHKWKKTNSPTCTECNDTENYEHFIIKCKRIQEFWKTINGPLFLCGYQINIQTLKDIILGQNILQRQYHELNVLIHIISFSIYKSYMASKRRTHFNTLKLLCLQEIKFTTLHVKGRKYNLLKTFLINSQANTIDPSHIRTHHI